MLKEKEAGKAEREANVRKVGYPAYTTSVGWLGYSDEKVRRLTLGSLQQGFNHFKVCPLGCNLHCVGELHGSSMNTTVLTLAAEGRCRR